MTCFRLNTGETLHHWCIRNHICYHNVYRKVEEGHTADAAAAYAIQRKPKGVPNRKHFYHGKWIGDIFPRPSAPYQRVLKRLQKGYTIETAVEREVGYESRAA